MSPESREKVVTGVITAVSAAVILGGLTLFWNAASSGGLVKLLGGVTADDVSRMIDERPQPTIPSPEQVDERLALQFEGAVVAFDGPCPVDAGWESFTDAAGKVLLGAGQGVLRNSGPHSQSPQGTETLLTRVRHRDEGGAETHTLIPDEMPEHNHATWIHQSADDQRGFQSVIVDRKFTLLSVVSDNRNDGRASGTDWAGNSEPHNNMPPYIALYFCKKTEP